jgi:hypothetical protein
MLLPEQLTIQPRDGFKHQWAEDRLTLVDIALLTGGGPLADLIDETVGAFPEVTRIGMMPIPGVTFDQLVRTKRPTVAFRRANQGATLGRSTYVNREYRCHIFNPRWESDKAVADRSPGGPNPIIAEEAAAVLESSWEHLGKQFYYGLENDPEGFPGLISIYDVDTMEVDATGSTAGEKTSVWAFRLNRNQTQFLLGVDGTLDVSDIDIRDITDDDGKRFEAYVQSLLAHIGMKVSDMRSVGRIKNLTKDTGKGLTDDLIMELILKFPTNQPPDVLFMNTIQREELRQSRVTDLLVSPPVPTSSHGIPIVATDAIKQGETE